MVSSVEFGTTSALFGQSTPQTRILDRIDSDGDGTITKEEFITHRPEDMDEEQAEEMWSTLDTEGTGSLSGSDFISLMQSMRPPRPPQGGDESQRSAGLQSLLEKIDEDEDGTITEAEFLAARPEDMSEEQAEEMWSMLDTEGAGSLSQTEFLSAMETLKPPAGQAPMGSSVPPSENGEESEADSDALTQAILSAIQQYTSGLSSEALSGNLLASSGLLSTTA
ncbi:MAG: casA [Desulfacinum sp.]|jgi:Ca2+-binding EF-hand superfamily protein|nr:casA [Desulfacinum sp.]